MVFTGIVQATGKAELQNAETGAFAVRCDFPFFENCRLGDSVAVNGVCLTVTGKDHQGKSATFTVMQETRCITTLGTLGEMACNLEHALKMGEHLGGHLVLGHVDETGSIESISTNSDGSCDVWIQWHHMPSSAAVHKGSVTVEGVSLTVASIDNAQKRLRVSLIPHTLNMTTLKNLRRGQAVNIEFDKSLLQMSQVRSDVISVTAAPSSIDLVSKSSLLQQSLSQPAPKFLLEVRKQSESPPPPPPPKTTNFNAFVDQELLCKKSTV